MPVCPSDLPIDLRTGFDLNIPEGQSKVMKIIEEQKPEIVWKAIVCTPWTSIQNANDPTKVAAMRRKAMPMVHVCVRVAWYQIQKGRKFVIENPLTSQLWSLAELKELMQYEGASANSAALCTFGLEDAEKPGYYLQKSFRLVHNFPVDCLTPLFKHCDASHPHGKVEGRLPGGLPKSAYSQIYRFRFFRATAKLFAAYLRNKESFRTQGRSEHRSHYVDTDHVRFIEDIFDMADFS